MASNLFSDRTINWAARVASFMESLHDVDAVRYMEAIGKTIPYGDMAYGQALHNWNKAGRPKDSFFSYAKGERPCPLLMAFRKEISEHFGLPILTEEEADKEIKRLRGIGRKLLTKNVLDWGLN